MSNFIKVNHSKFENAANAIDVYVNRHKSNVKKSNREITTLSSGWQGKDFTQFQSQWDRISDKDSTSQKMLKALESYSQFLRHAAKKYQEAQARAVNSANRIPKR